MRILEYPKVQQINSREWKLLEPLEYHVGSPESSVIVTVPDGYETDFASVPKAFWPVFPPFGRYSPASVLHDFLYGNRGEPLLPYVPYKDYGRGKFGKMRQAIDAIFLEAMEVMEVNWITRKTMHRMVRMWGWIHY